MKIGILGAGATGSIVGYFLKKGGADVWLVDISAPHINAIRQNQLHVVLSRRNSGVAADERMSINATLDPAEVGECNVVILLTKTRDTENAIKNAPGLFGKDTYVLTLQNGIGADEKLLEFFPKERVGCGCLHIQSELTAPGEVRAVLTKTVGGSFCSILGNKPAQLMELEKLMGQTELRAQYAEDTRKMIWQRAMINLPTSFTTALIGLPAPYIAGESSGRDLFEQIIREAVAVANAIGIDLNADEEIDDFLMNTIPMIDAFPSSALDIFSGKATEVESLNGAVSRIGHRVGISTPFNDAIADIVRVMEATYDKRRDIAEKFRLTKI